MTFGIFFGIAAAVTIGHVLGELILVLFVDSGPINYKVDDRDDEQDPWER